MNYEKTEIVKYLKMFLPTLKTITARSFNSCNSLLTMTKLMMKNNQINDEIFNELTKEERSLYILFSIKNMYYLKINNKQFVFDFLEEINFDLTLYSCLKENEEQKVLTRNIIKWLKLNLTENELSDILNDALMETDSVMESFLVSDLKHLDIEGQEHKFNILNIIKELYQYYEDRESSNKSIEELTKESFLNIQQILFHDDNFIKEGLSYFINKFYDTFYLDTFYILAYSNKKKDIDITTIHKRLNKLSEVDYYLLSLNDDLIDSLKKIKKVEFLITLKFYNKLYGKFNKKEDFKEIFKESLNKEIMMITVPYSYLMNELTQEERKRYVEKINTIKNKKYLEQLFLISINPLDLLKLSLTIYSIDKNEEVLELLEIKPEYIEIIKPFVTEDLRISDEAFKMLKIKHSL